MQRPFSSAKMRTLLLLIVGGTSASSFIVSGCLNRCGSSNALLGCMTPTTKLGKETTPNPLRTNCSFLPMECQPTDCLPSINPFSKREISNGLNFLLPDLMESPGHRGGQSFMGSKIGKPMLLQLLVLAADGRELARIQIHEDDGSPSTKSNALAYPLIDRPLGRYVQSSRTRSRVRNIPLPVSRIRPK